MITNTDATLFIRTCNPSTRLDEWLYIYVPHVWWRKSEKSNVTPDGLKVADVTVVRIPDISIPIKKDDYLVKGHQPIQIDTVKDLAGKDCIKVTAVNYNTFGDNPHIKVVGV